MVHVKPVTGQKVIDFVADKPLWSDIIDMLDWWHKERVESALPGGTGKCLPIGWNDNAGGMLPGQIAYVDSTVQPSVDSIPIENLKQRPIFKLVSPVWHNKIDKVVVLHKSILEYNVANILGPRILPALGTVVDPTDKYVMVDPLDPTKLKTSTSGIFGLVGTLEYGGDTVLIVDTSVNQPVWLFTTLDAPSGGFCPADLKRGDGIVYGEVVISDPLNTLSGATEESPKTGLCMQVGNFFVALGGGGGGSVDPKPIQRVFCLVGDLSSEPDRLPVDPRYPLGVIDTSTLVRLSSDPFSIDSLTGGSGTVGNPLKLSGVQGDGLILEFNHSSGAYFISAVYPQRQLRLWGELAADAPTGGAATISINPTVPIGIGAMPSTPFNATDVFDKAINAKTGHRILVEYDMDQSQYFVVGAEHTATKVRCTIDGNQDDTPDPVIVEIVLGMDGETPTELNDAAMEVDNRFKATFLRDGDVCEVHWDNSIGRWYLAQTAAPENPPPIWVS